jgi:mannose-6-phosphate isomerase-like protein (cupin superfamily)
VIVTGSTTTVRRFGGDARVDWRCLARRGMLHSECESVDLVRLAAGTRLALASEVDETVLVVRGSVLLHDDSGERTLNERALVLVPAGEKGELAAVGDEVELVLIRVWPRAISAALPPRVPELVQ